jgi:hypothetical protein
MSQAGGSRIRKLARGLLGARRLAYALDGRPSLPIPRYPPK